MCVALSKAQALPAGESKPTTSTKTTNNNDDKNNNNDNNIMDDDETLLGSEADIPFEPTFEGTFGVGNSLFYQVDF